MSERVRFLMSFRARLILLLTSFLLLTILLVLVLDHWAQKRISKEIEAQNTRMTEAVNTGYSDFMEAIGLALQSLDSQDFLYEKISRDALPRTVENIIVTDRDGKVKDSTLESTIGQRISIPQEERPEVRAVDPIGDEPEHHEHVP